MSQINVTDLTFYYEDSFDHIFDHVSFSIDTRWKLGFIGRNGKGKTTFLNLLLGKYEYRGKIHSSAAFDYFPYQLPPEYMQLHAVDFFHRLKADCELWRVLCELDKLKVDEKLLYRPFYTLSNGERTKVLLAVLFSGENDFLLIDEPTNHLDQASREIVKQYLAGKKGFILVSHDRDLLDACIDHVLVLNRCSIEVQRGNFSSWWENKERADAFSLAENEKHKKEIHKLKKASKRASEWASKSERSKIGYDPVKEPDHPFRAYIGAKTEKMQSRAKQLERRMENEIRKKEGLLEDIEHMEDLKMTPMRCHKDLLVYAEDYGLNYAGRGAFIFRHLNLQLRQGERLFLCGRNGCGKSSLIKDVLRAAWGQEAASRSMKGMDPGAGHKNNPFLPEDHLWEGAAGEESLVRQGTLRTASGLTVSYVNQDTSFLRGGIRAFCEARRLDESLFCAVLRQLALERGQFTKQLEDFSEGQKKKVLLAASLLTPAHLYIWDEPLNYIDVFSRIQIEKLILEYQPAMLVVEHDVRFREKIATRVYEFPDAE